MDMCVRVVVSKERRVNCEQHGTSCSVLRASTCALIPLRLRAPLHHSASRRLHGLGASCRMASALLAGANRVSCASCGVRYVWKGTCASCGIRYVLKGTSTLCVEEHKYVMC